MKSIFKSFLCAGLLLTATISKSDNCNRPCQINSNGNVTPNTVNAPRNTNCNRGCDTSGFSCRDPRSYYGIRSQGANTARELVGWQELIYNAPASCDNYGAFAVAYEYQRTFRPSRIAQYLFCTDTLNFVGSQATNRDITNRTQLVAENFGLPSNFNQSLRIRPRITNHIVDFQGFLSLDNWFSGLYVRIHAPLVNTRWSLFENCSSSCSNSCSTSCNTSCSTSCSNSCGNSCSKSCTAGYNNGNNIRDNNLCPDPAIVPAFAPAGAFGINPSNVLSPVPVLNNLQDALSGNSFGAMSQAWQFGRFPFCEQRKTRLADVDLILGWNFWDCEGSHIGAFIQAVAPTGNKANPRYLFSPVVGNGRHWELGGGLSAHTLLWDGCGEQSLGVYFEGNVTHMFKNHQVRSFDFANNGPLSRYLLLKELGTTNTPNAFNGTLINAINVNTRNAEVSIRVKGDATLKFAYRNCGFGLDLGYNIYGNSGEKVCIKRGNACGIFFDPNTSFVIQGGQPTQGFLACSGSTLSGATTVLNLNSSQSNATIFNNNPSTTTVSPAQTQLAVISGTPENITNAGVIAANPLAGTTVGQSLNLPTNTCPGIGANEVVLTPQAVARLGTTTPVPGIGESLPGDIATATVGTTAVPGAFVYSDTSVLDRRSGAAKSVLTHKFFGFVNYSILNDSAFLGVGGEVEVDGQRCRKGGHNQWGIIVKTGFAY